MAIEEWVVGSSGFWRKGQVNEDQHFVAFKGTWAEVRDRSEAMMAMELRHAQERDDLAARHRRERETLWGGA